MRRALFNLHLSIALAAAAFVVVLGITGSIMAFEPELDRLLHPSLFLVTPSGSPKSLIDLAAAASVRFPGERPLAFGLPPSADLSAYVVFKSGAVYVNPYTAEILGIRHGLDFLAYVHQIHLRLLAGEAGRRIVSWAGVAMLFLVASGLYLWWPVKRIAVNWRGSPRKRWFDLHNTVGVLAFAFLAILAFTGIVIGFEAVSVPLLYRMTSSEPLPVSFKVKPEAVAAVTPDAAVEIARHALPGATPIQVNVPPPATSYRVAMRFPEDLTPGGRSRVHINQYTGEVLLAESSRTTAAGTRLVILNRAIHTGDIFGIPTKALMSLASLAAVAQVVTGVMMWVRRRD